MGRVLAIAALAQILAACAAPSATSPVVPTRATDFKPAEIRRPAIFVRFGFSGQFEDKERQAMLADYEGALLEGLNARAVLAKAVQLLAERDPKLEPAASVEQARALGADHAVYVQVRVVRPAQPVFCAETRRAFRAPATALTQMVGVLRVSDGARRLVVPATGGGLDVYDFEPDCDNPRESKRRTPTEAINDAVTRLLNRVVGP